MSDRYRFVFVANLRTGSTSIHAALGRFATERLAATSEGKHLSLREIYSAYDPARVDRYFKWAVIREPVDYVWSLYQLHRRPAFDGRPHSTAGLTFEEYCESAAGAWMRVPQSSRFERPDGEFGLDLLITMDRLAEGFSYLKHRLGLPNVLLPRLNTTDAEPHVSADLRRRIETDWHADLECIRVHGNRERTEHGPHSILGELSSDRAAER